MPEHGMAPWRTLITAVHPHPSVKINHGATFLVTDRQGAIPHGSEGEYGLYSADTRFLSRHELRLNGRRPESVATVWKRSIGNASNRVIPSGTRSRDRSRRASA